MMNTQYTLRVLNMGAVGLIAMFLASCQRPATVAAPEPVMPAYPDNIALRQRGLLNDTFSNDAQAASAPGATAPKQTAAKPESLEEWGKQLFNQHGCVSCHSNKQVAPPLERLYGQESHKLTDGSAIKVDEAYLRESIVNPTAKVAAGYPPIMPSFRHLPKEEVDALVAYLKTL
ncbi:MAG: hypothetical protein D6697_04925 [Armatimonadetes bacterium]|nr:MAG: hypothetical protein D6697_04925 [Armatimonadota bacterium]